MRVFLRTCNTMMLIFTYACRNHENTKSSLFCRFFLNSICLDLGGHFVMRALLLCTPKLVWSYTKLIWRIPWDCSSECTHLDKNVISHPDWKPISRINKFRLAFQLHHTENYKATNSWCHPYSCIVSVAIDLVFSYLCLELLGWVVSLLWCSWVPRIWRA